MPQRMRVEAFIAALTGGDYVWALTEFYCSYPTKPDDGTPRSAPQLCDGIDQHLQQYRRRTQQPCVHTYLIDGDNVVIHFIHDMLDDHGDPCSVHQLLLQRWAGERIADERYFYERARPATTATPQPSIKTPNRVSAKAPMQAPVRTQASAAADVAYKSRARG